MLGICGFHKAVFDGIMVLCLRKGKRKHPEIMYLNVVSPKVHVHLDTAVSRVLVWKARTRHVVVEAQVKES